MAKDYKTISFPHAKGIVVSGDIHGDFTSLVYKCCVEYGMTDTLIIVAGDCGFGFESPIYYEDVYKKCRNKLSKANNWIVFVRGNHDNPAYFNLQHIKHARWMTIPDYSVIKACGHTILCVGGATSIDRALRMASKRYKLPSKDNPLMPTLYWHNEQPVFDQERLKQTLGKIRGFCRIVPDRHLVPRGTLSNLLSSAADAVREINQCTTHLLGFCFVKSTLATIAIDAIHLMIEPR